MSPYLDDSELIRCAAAGDGTAPASLWQRHKSRLRQMIRLRLDGRLQRRVDPSDVLRDAYIDLAERYVRALTRLQSILEGMSEFRASGSE